MTSTDNTSKPLKTVEEWFEAYMPKGTVKPNKKIDAEKAELMTLIMANWRKRAKADLYQLMLSLKPDNEFEETQWEIGYNQAITDWEAKLSEHFNGEGGV